MSFMKKIRCVSAALILLAAVPAVWAAPSPSALASSAIAESTWAAVGIRDIKALCDPSGLLAQYLKMRQSTELLEKNSSFLKDLDIHVGMNSKCEPTTVAFAGELLRDLDGSPTSLDLTSADFQLNAPAGSVLTPLGSLFVEECGTIYLAKLDRDGRSYVLGAVGSAGLLNKMAAAPDREPEGEGRVLANIWSRFHLSQETMAEEDIHVAVPVQIEVGVQDTSSSSLRVMLWSNVRELMASSTEKKFAALLNDDMPAQLPLLMGSGDLLAVFNMAAPFIPEKLTPEEVMPDEESPGNLSELIQSCQSLGIGWQDLLSILRNNITLGLAGKMTTAAGEFPGLYLHLAGAKGEAAASIAGVVASSASSELDAALEPFSQEKWTGYRSAMPVPAFVASGPEGLILGAMDLDQLGLKPSVDPRIAGVAEAPQSCALAVNNRALLAVLKKLEAAYGALFYAQNAELKPIMDQAFAVMDVIDAATLSFKDGFKDAGTVTLELFFDVPKLRALALEE